MDKPQTKSTNSFDNHVQDCINRIQSTLGAKGKEYQRNNDRFHNFNKAAKVLDTTPEKALLGFWTKHIVSVLDIINDLDGGKTPTEELLSEKISDNINYLILLEGLIKENYLK